MVTTEQISTLTPKDLAAIADAADPASVRVAGACPTVVRIEDGVRRVFLSEIDADAYHFDGDDAGLVSEATARTMRPTASPKAVKPSTRTAASRDLQAGDQPA